VAAAGFFFLDTRAYNNSSSKTTKFNPVEIVSGGCIIPAMTPGTANRCWMQCPLWDSDWAGWRHCTATPETLRNFCGCIYPKKGKHWGRHCALVPAWRICLGMQAEVFTLTGDACYWKRKNLDNAAEHYKKSRLNTNHTFWPRHGSLVLLMSSNDLSNKSIRLKTIEKHHSSRGKWCQRSIRRKDRSGSKIN